MKPVDFRNENFAALKSRLTGLRAVVLAAWQAHGPGTTRAVAKCSGIDLLTFRPRSTELFQLGAICLVEPGGLGSTRAHPTSSLSSSLSSSDGAHEGVYRARTEAEWQAWLAEQKQPDVCRQQQLQIA